jgi:hypothetical protein
MRKLPHFMELNVFGEISLVVCFALEENARKLSDWQLQQTTEAKMMVRMHFIGIVAVFI